MSMIEVYLVEGFTPHNLDNEQESWPVAAYTVNTIAQNHADLAGKSNKACLQSAAHNLPSNSRVNNFDKRPEASKEPVQYRVRHLSLSFGLQVLSGESLAGCPLAYPMAEGLPWKTE